MIKYNVFGIFVNKLTVDSKQRQIYLPAWVLWKYKCANLENRCVLHVYPLLLWYVRGCG